MSVLRRRRRMRLMQRVEQAVVKHLSGLGDQPDSWESLEQHVRVTFGSWGVWLELALMLAKFLFEVWLESKSIAVVRTASISARSFAVMDESSLAELSADLLASGETSLAGVANVFLTIAEHESHDRPCPEPN